MHDYFHNQVVPAAKDGLVMVYYTASDVFNLLHCYLLSLPDHKKKHFFTCFPSVKSQINLHFDMCTLPYVPLSPIALTVGLMVSPALLCAPV